jgi:hypothetical protein
MPDRKLFQLRLRDLRIPLDQTWLADCLADLNDELRNRNITVRAHGWISDEWFSPQHTPGIAFPFYLTHPRLMRLERRMMLEVEGGTRRECMRILRHEAGHVVQQSFRVHRRRRWQELFGRASMPYPDHYRPNPTSKDYVQHLRRWYAQCHPDEDFAETFAVWLTPRNNWRSRYAGWPALEKLEYVDELMGELAGKKPGVKPRTQVDPISQMSITLGEHYVRKRERYAVDTPTVFDRDLTRIFSNEPRHAGAPTAASILRRNRAQIIRSVARWTGEYPVALDAALDDMIDRCRALKLRAPRAERQVRLELTAMLSSKAVYTLYSSSRRQWFAV